MYFSEKNTRGSYTARLTRETVIVSIPSPGRPRQTEVGASALTLRVFRGGGPGKGARAASEGGGVGERREAASLLAGLAGPTRRETRETGRSQSRGARTRHRTAAAIRLARSGPGGADRRNVPAAGREAEGGVASPRGEPPRSPHSPLPRMLTSDRANHSSPPLSANPAEAPPAAHSPQPPHTRHPAPPAERALGRGLREPSPRDVLSSSTLELDRSPQLHTRR